MGLINDIWKKAILPTAIDLDGGDPEEVELRTTKTNEVCEKLREEQRKLAPITKKLNLVKNRVRYFENKEKQGVVLTQKQCDARGKHLEIQKVLEKRSKPFKDNVERYKSELSRINKKIETMVAKRSNNKNSTDTLIKDELTKRGIYTEVYHGGVLTGNNCKKLCVNGKDFVRSARDICIRKYEENKNSGNVPVGSPANVDELKERFKVYEDALRIADIAFSNLNIIAPDENEMKETEVSVRRLGEVWKKVVGVTYTPKVHSILDHACECQRRFGGLGDKTEQGIEQRHQIQKAMCHRLKRFAGNFEQRMKKQLEYEWRQRHPAVEQMIFSVNKSTRKRKNRELTLAEENSLKKIKLVTSERKDFMRRLVLELDAEAEAKAKACEDADVKEGGGVMVGEMTANDVNGEKDVITSNENAREDIEQT